ncbi:MAG: FG-GAP-like repeat-containing protein [Polyangiales bacterium]
MERRRLNGSWEHGFRASLLVLAWGLTACGGDGGSEPSPALDASVLDAAFGDAQEIKADGQVVTPEVPPVLPPVSNVQRRNLFLVAHQDDDLGLMNPDLLNRVLSGEPVRTIYLTSGDAGLDCGDYVKDRETGVKIAYALMASVPDVWDERELLVLGKTVRVARLRGTQIELVFFGFHNGGYNVDITPDLEMLWNGGRATVETRTLDGRTRSDSYTRSDLIAVLRQMLVDWRPTHVQTLDSSRLQPMVWPFDHSDHVHSALFALSALMQYGRPYSLSMYRAYNDMFEQPNISLPAAQRKKEIFHAYLEHDSKVCDTGTTVLCGQETPCDLPGFYTDFDRQYRTVVYENVSGLVRGPFGTCMTGDAERGAVRLQPCDRDSRAQHFKVSTDGSIEHLASGLCVDSGAGTRGSQLTLARCRDRMQQRFLLTTQRQLRGSDSTCVQADADAMTLRECALDPRQMDWSPGMFPNFVTGLIEGLTNWEIPDWISYYGTLSFGDVEGDGDDDVCVRRGDGVYCAFADGAGFSSFARVLDGFRDDQGWFAAQYGATVQLGDIDGDGAAEVCGRGAEGVWCADWNSGHTAFEQPSLRSGDFGDAQGYQLDASRYRSLRITDLDGDGMGDLCARAEQGIFCARSAGRTFSSAKLWTGEQFTDALGWGKEEYGSTLRFGDVDGDGDPDVCGRAKEGILCARNNGAGRFVDPHLWSHTGDFGDGNGWNKQLSYYGSIRLADIDRDGNVDVCGRGPLGLLCSMSTSTAFTVATSLGSAEAFSDQSGWRLDRYGSTLGLMDLNLDGFADLCAWGPGYDGKVGLNCSLAD